MAFLFGCSHKNRSFPITLRRDRRNPNSAETYVVCFECGREFPYSWEEMKIVKAKREPILALEGAEQPQQS